VIHQKIFFALLAVTLLCISPAQAENSSTLLLLLLPRHATSGWGATFPSQKDRPDRSWLDQFTGITPIEVTSTLEAALQQCPQGACVVSVNKLRLDKTFYLSRSNTKIVGLPGNTLTFADAGGGSFIELETGVHDIWIQRIDFDGQAHDYGSNAVFGILVNGENINNIAISNNHIHHLYSNEDAHGTAVYGTGNSESTAITNVIVEGNTIENMRTGSSESIAINGNVKNWEITGNLLRHINNIAIDAIGGEGTAPVKTLNGRVLPGDLDAARYGFIEHNTVTDMSTLTNPAYGSEHSWAGAIYVDGAHHLLIADNQVTDAEWAYDIGAENCVKSRHILLQNNQASASYYGDFYVGGYAAGGFEDNPRINCDPRTSQDEQEGHGNVEYVTAKNNAFTTPSGTTHFIRTIETGNRIRKTIIIHPGFAPQHPDGNVTGDENSIRVTE
jgi:hypothetical protein